jgi:hypothetical protein
MGSSFSPLARASTARGRPFGPWKELTFESQKKEIPVKDSLQSCQMSWHQAPSNVCI